MNILIVGQGGREHTLAWKVGQSDQVERVYVAPGNAGTAEEPKTENVSIDPTAVNELLQFAKKNHIALTIVGPENALAAGIVDAFQEAGLAIFGPVKAAAQLETSKVFSKKFMIRHQLPTAIFETFTNTKSAIHYLQHQSFPIVIKVDGLAAGKGVVIAYSLEEAEQAIIDILDHHSFGEAGQEIVIEEFLEGRELSFIAMVDGKYVLPLATSQDYKKRDDNDLGPNTGGMGAYSPVSSLSPGLYDKIVKSIMEPTIAGLQQENIPYVGFLYAGLMITANEEPKLLEFNARLGDPETQVLMMRLKSDLISLIQAALRGELNRQTIEWNKQDALTVALAAQGYPLQYEMGHPIVGLDRCKNDPLVKVFHAGTQKDPKKGIVTNGGRILNVTALGDSLSDARARAYAAAKKIHWEGCYYREDIGLEE
jgi:phosphoribosylamine--glycine ligase